MKEKEMDKFSLAIDDSLSLLRENKEWVCRYAGYAQEIIANIDLIRNKKKIFHQWAPLYLYMNVTKAKSSAPIFSLRYLGQRVAFVNVSGKRVTLKDMAGADDDNDVRMRENNERDFGCSVAFHDKTWTSVEAKEFRKYFSSNPVRRSENNKGNEERRVESMLLTEFSKSQGKFKNVKLHNIQPIKIAGIARFQMPTPLRASGSQVQYVKKGGGIDILARVGRGRGTTLCIMEVKDEYINREPPEKAITQGLYYAAFIRELLRSKSGNDWWHIFGFGGTVRKKLTLYVCCVMPFNKAGVSDTSFRRNRISIGNDTIELHYIYFSEDGKVNNIETSLEGKK